MRDALKMAQWVLLVSTALKQFGSLIKGSYRSMKRRSLPSWMGPPPEVDAKTIQVDTGKQDDSLKFVEFSGTVHYYTTVHDAAEASVEIIKRLDDEPELVVGFDMEWPVNFRIRKESKTALIQISTDEHECHLFHLSAMSGFPTALKLLILDERIKKVGVGIEGDLWKLNRDFGFAMLPVVENSSVNLSVFANSVLNSGQNWSLERLCLFVLKKNLSKDKQIRCGSWDKHPLSDAQMKYAALDAHVSLQIYKELLKMKKDSISS